MAQPEAPYPVQFSVDFPDRPLNRLTTFFRPFVAIPILIVIAALEGSVLFFPTLLMILFRRKYPRWWFDWNVALIKFSNRVGVFLALLRDEYPSTDEEQAVHIEVPYPDVETELNRWLPLVKWFLAIPHYIVLVLLSIAAVVAIIVAWFAILFTGRYPRDLFAFVVGLGRWYIRVWSYAFMLVTDRYPPFRLGQ